MAYDSNLRSDTGLWHLNVYLTGHGVQAWLILKDEPATPPRLLLNESWTPQKEGLLQKISNVIYDHPEVLDDYSASIYVESPRTLMVPDDILSEDGIEEEIYAKVYSSRAEDVMTDRQKGREAAIFTLTPGILGFLQRTFPGARLYSHIGRLTSIFRQTGGGYRIFACIREGEVDLIAFNGEALLSASTQPWKEWSDIVYRIFNLSDVYGLNRNETDLWIEGNCPGKEDLRKFSEQNFAAVRQVDRGTAPEEMPPAIALSI